MFYPFSSSDLRGNFTQHLVNIAVRYFCMTFVGVQVSIKSANPLTIGCQGSDMLSCLSPTQSHRKVGTLWRKAGLSWSDFLPEEEDIQDFISQQVGERNSLYYGMEASQETIAQQPKPSLLPVSPPPVRSSSSLWWTALALRQPSLRQNCPPRCSTGSWRDSCWRTWPVMSRSLTG